MPFIVTKTNAQQVGEVQGFKDSIDLGLATLIVKNHFCSVTISE
ncbi:hypothetical protein [Xanthomonas sp. GPE 39]|nr:hypothetical protein [Xanthomonas sp. GPE 39]